MEELFPPCSMQKRMPLESWPEPVERLKDQLFIQPLVHVSSVRKSSISPELEKLFIEIYTAKIHSIFYAGWE